ncbi:MAG: aminotransferase class V-fold PLP-dependent enzyme [Actinomycetota bacterium]
MATPLTVDEVAALRAATPFAADRIHLNHAGDSPSSGAVLSTQRTHLELESAIGGYEAANAMADAEGAVYDSIARLLGCQSHEIARHEHATAAWNAAYWSVPMTPGQVVLTAEAAYGANAVAHLHAERTRGVTVEVIPSDESGQLDLDALGERLDRAPTGSGDGSIALIALTHVPTNGGLVNPAGEVGALARAAGVPFLLDACQSVGQLDLDVGALGCDLLSATGRKYLRGPRGTGFLFAADAIVDRLVPAQPDHHGADWSATRTYDLAPGARRFEYWEYNHAAWLGLGTAVDEALTIGLDRIEATVDERATTLRSRLADVGLPVHDLGRRRCGIVTTTVPGEAAADTKRRLAEASTPINVSVTTPDSTRWDFERRGLDAMVRVSVHATTTDEEIDRAVAVLSGRR